MDAKALSVPAFGAGRDETCSGLENHRRFRLLHPHPAGLQKRCCHTDAVRTAAGMGPVGLKNDKGRVGTRIDRRHQKIDRTGRVGARGQHQMTSKTPVACIQSGKPVGNCGSGNVGKAFRDDIAEFALGMDIDHADRSLSPAAAHPPAASRSALIVARGEMASVEVTISTMAPFGAAQARS